MTVHQKECQKICQTEWQNLCQIEPGEGDEEERTTPMKVVLASLARHLCQKECQYMGQIFTFIK